MGGTLDYVRDIRDNLDIIKTQGINYLIITSQYNKNDKTYSINVFENIDFETKPTFSKILSEKALQLMEIPTQKLAKTDKKTPKNKN